MSYTFHCTNFDEGFVHLNKHFFFDKEYDYERTGVTAHNFDVKMISDSPCCSLCLHQFNYTPNKWKMLNNLYLNPEELGVMIARIKHYKNQRKHKNYVPDIALQFKTRRNVSGACLLSVSLGYHNGIWHCSVTSRASEITCRWPIDLIFINVLLRTISEYIGIDFTKITVYWNMISTYQSITSMPLFLIMIGREDWFKEAENIELNHWQEATLKRYKKCYTGDAYSNYGVQRRPMEAYRMLKGKIPYKNIIPTESLSVCVVPFAGVLEEDYDEVDILNIDNETLEKLEKEATDKDLWGAGGYR